MTYTLPFSDRVSYGMAEPDEAEPAAGYRSTRGTRRICWRLVMRGRLRVYNSDGVDVVHDDLPF